MRWSCGACSSLWPPTWWLTAM